MDTSAPNYLDIGMRHHHEGYGDMEPYLFYDRFNEQAFQKSVLVLYHGQQVYLRFRFKSIDPIMSESIS